METTTKTQQRATENAHVVSDENAYQEKSDLQSSWEKVHKNWKKPVPSRFLQMYSAEQGSEWTRPSDNRRRQVRSPSPVLTVFDTTVPRKKFDNWGIMDLNMMLRNATKPDLRPSGRDNEGEEHTGEPVRGNVGENDNVGTANTAGTELQPSAGLINETQVSQNLESPHETGPTNGIIASESSNVQDASHDIPQNAEGPIHSDESISSLNDFSIQTGTTLIQTVVPREEDLSNHSNNTSQPDHESVSLDPETTAGSVYVQNFLHEPSELAPSAPNRRSNVGPQESTTRTSSRSPESSHTIQEWATSSMGNTNEMTPLEAEVESHGSESAGYSVNVFRISLAFAEDEHDDTRLLHSPKEPSSDDDALTELPGIPESTSKGITSPRVNVQPSPTGQFTPEAFVAIIQPHSNIPGSLESLESVKPAEPRENEDISSTDYDNQEYKTRLSQAISQEVVSVDSQNSTEGASHDVNENTTFPSGDEMDVDTVENAHPSDLEPENPKSDPAGNYTKDTDEKELGASPMEEVALTHDDSIVVSSLMDMVTAAGRTTEAFEMTKKALDIQDSEQRSNFNESFTTETPDNRQRDISKGPDTAVETGVHSPSVTSVSYESDDMHVDSMDFQKDSSLQEQKGRELTTKPVSAASPIDGENNIEPQAKDDVVLSQSTTTVDDRLVTSPLQTEKGDEPAATEDLENLRTQNEDQTSQTLSSEDSLPLPTITAEPVNSTVKRPRLKLITQSSSSRWMRKSASANDSNSIAVLSEDVDVQDMPRDGGSLKLSSAAPVSAARSIETRGKRRLRSKSSMDDHDHSGSPVPSDIINPLSRSQTIMSAITNSPTVASPEASPLSEVSTNSRPIKFKLRFKESLTLESPRPSKRRKLSKSESLRSSNTPISENPKREMLDCIVVRLDLENAPENAESY